MKIKSIKDYTISYFFEIIVTSFLVVLISIFVISNTLQSVELNNYQNQECRISVYKASSSFKNSNLEFKINENKNLDLYPNISNLKCLGKVSSLTTESNFTIINTGSNSKLDYLIFLSLGFLIVQKSKHRFFGYIGLFLSFLVLLTIYNFKLNTYFIFIYVSLLIAFWFIEKKQDLTIMVILTFIFIRLNSLNVARLNSNETYYIGRIFKVSNNELSVYNESQSGYLVVYDAFIKLLINIFSENFYIICNILLSIFFSIFIIKIFKIYRISLFFAIPFLYLLNRYQSIIAGTVFFKYLEPNTFASLFFIASVYFLLNKKIYFSIFSYILAFYFHLAFSIVVSPLYVFIFFNKVKFDFKIYSKYFLTAFVSLLPFIIYVFQNIYKNTEDIDRKFINEFFIKKRLPHHLYPFSEDGPYSLFSNYDWLLGFERIIFMLIVVLSLRFFFKNYTNTEIFKIVIFIFSTISVYSIAIYLFPFSDFVLLVLFKISIYYTMFVIIFVLNFLDIIFKSLVMSVDKQSFIIYSLIIFTIFSFTRLSFQTSTNFLIKEDKLIFNSLGSGSKDQHDLLNYLEYSKPSVLIYPGPVWNDNFILLLEAYSQVPNYVTWKFVPNQSKVLIGEWIERNENKSKFYKGDCDVFSDIPNLNFLIFNNQNYDASVIDCGVEVFQNNTYTIFRLK